MRRTRLVLAVVAATALLISVSAPAMADTFDRFDRFGFGDVDQAFDQEAQSGDVDLSFQTSNTGDNSNVCAPALQFGNTGNVQNEQGFTSVGNGFDNGDRFFHDGDRFFRDGDRFFDFNNGDVEFQGSTVTFEPSLDTTCDQTVQQSSAASSD